MLNTDYSLRKKPAIICKLLGRPIKAIDTGHMHSLLYMHAYFPGRGGIHELAFSFLFLFLFLLFFFLGGGGGGVAPSWVTP